MPRRKTKAPSPDEATQDAPAGPTPAPPAVADAEPAQAPAAPTEPASAPLLPDVVIPYGDLEEDGVDWLAQRNELAAYYGAVGPVETALVDRITDLRWRLERFARAERSMVTSSTIALKWQRSIGRITESHGELSWAKTQSSGVLGAERSTTIRLARNDLAALVEKMDGGEDLDAFDIYKPIQIIFGCDRDGTPRGQGRSLYETWGLVEMARQDAEERDQGLPNRFADEGEDEGDDGDEDDRPANHVEDFERLLRRQLGEALDMVDGLIGSLELDEKARDLATVEARGIPAADALRGLAVYEQHLQHSLADATTELQRTIARRRLAGLARRARLV